MHIYVKSPLFGRFGRNGNTTKSHCMISILRGRRSPCGGGRCRSASTKRPPNRGKNFFLTVRGSVWKELFKLRTNLKTHKPHGQVKPRAMHSATRNPLVPLGMCVAWERGWVLSFEWHILNSVEEFHEQSRNWCLDQLTGSSLDMSKISLCTKYLAKDTCTHLVRQGTKSRRKNPSVFATEQVS